MTYEDRLLDLLTISATQALSDRESSELDQLLAQQDRWEREDFELAATEIDLALQSTQPQAEAMPEHLKRRILNAAKSEKPALEAVTATPASTSAPLAYAGWLAAAACLLLMFWTPWRTETPTAPAAAPTIAELRDQLLGSDGTVQLAWAPPEIEGYEQVRGDVVWNQELQQGFMRLSGLPKNIPAEAQYQLWIVDSSRDPKPIDGGVFDVLEDGEVIVPIDAKLMVNTAQAFAITLEQPGGVVVSDGPLLVIAAPTT